MQGDVTSSGTGSNGIDNIWLKAAVSGGLWAAVEIILGSFLHNLRVPMAGSILASFGIILMIAFFQIWPERGLIWRAGLICALMKSISPSAVILGPMTGIMMEALLLEAGIVLLGRNLAGYLAGGALALFSALLHKLMSLLLLYGFNIITIYLNLFYFASRQINIPEADPWLLISILGGLYLLIGALAALAGYIVGQRALKEPGTAGMSQRNPETGIMSQRNPETGIMSQRNPETGSMSQRNPEPRSRLLPKKPVSDIFEHVTGSFSLPLFILHITAIPGGLVLMNFSGRLVAYPVLIIYTLFCLVYYKNTIRRFKKPLFWFQLLVIILLATIFLESFEKGTPVINWSGILAGVDMNIRAILVVAGFSALSTELKNPLITNFLLKRGFRQLYLAISLAFRALPSMMEEISKPKRFFSGPFSSIREMVANATDWLEALKKNNDSA